MAEIVNPSKEDILINDILNGKGVSQEFIRKIAASINAINHNYTMPLGMTMNHTFDLAHFQSLMSNAWVREDGANVTETDFGVFVLANNITEYITGDQVYLKDSRGIWEVAHNAGRTDGKQLYESLDVGSFHQGDIKSHSHTYSKASQTMSRFDSGSSARLSGISTDNTSSVGSTQNTVNSIVKYRYIKVWNVPQV